MTFRSPIFPRQKKGYDKSLDLLRARDSVGPDIHRDLRKGRKGQERGGGRNIQSRKTDEKTERQRRRHDFVLYSRSASATLVPLVAVTAYDVTKGDARGSFYEIVRSWMSCTGVARKQHDIKGFTVPIVIAVRCVQALYQYCDYNIPPSCLQSKII